MRFGVLSRLRLAPRLALATLVTIIAMFLFNESLVHLIPSPPYMIIERGWLIDEIDRAVDTASESHEDKRVAALAALPASRHLNFRTQPRQSGDMANDTTHFSKELRKAIAAKIGVQVGAVRMTSKAFNENYVDRTVRTVVVIVSGLPTLLTAEMLKSQESMVLANLEIVAPLRDGSWLIVTQRDTTDAGRHYARYFLRLAGNLLFVTIFSIWMARSIVNPMSSLAAAAERLGREREPTPISGMKLPEFVAIADIFNEMQARLKRFVDERMQILAAISHDLRTPLTRLRLLAEYVPDKHQRLQILSDISDMETMVSTSLAFMSDDIHREPVSSVDIAALLISLSDNFNDIGEVVAYEGPDHAYLRCRPVAIRRAFTNLISNGCKYGIEVTIALSDGSNAIIIDIRDKGPGIPDEQAERAFQPFERLEASRNRETGGTGLGLTIARDVVRGHGGDIELVNDPWGFTVRVRLPRPEA